MDSQKYHFRQKTKGVVKRLMVEDVQIAGHVKTQNSSVKTGAKTAMLVCFGRMSYTSRNSVAKTELPTSPFAL